MEHQDVDFQNLVDSAPVLIWVSDASRACRYVNQRWCDFTGQSTQAALGQGWQVKIHPEDWPNVSRASHMAFELLQLFAVDFRLQRRDGEYRWMRSNASPTFRNETEFCGFIGTCVEIHDERMLREQAIQQQQRLKEFYEKTPVMMHAVDANGVLVSVSDDWLSHFGYTRKQVIGKNRTDFMPESCRKVAEKRDRQFLETGTSENLNYRFVTKDGEVRDVKLSAIAERDVEGRFVKSIAVMEDVTDTKKSIQRLQQTQKVFDQSGEAIFWLSLEGQILYVNQQACESLGYSSEELLGMFIWEIDPNFPREVWESIAWRESLHERKILRSLHQTKAGRQFPVEVNSKLVGIGDDVFMCAFVRDLTESIRSDNELHLAQRRLEETLRSGNIGLWDWDMRSDTVLFSSEWKTQVGLSPDAELLGYPSWEDRLHPEDRQGAIDRLHDYLEGRAEEYVSLFRFRHENGTYRWIRAQGRVFYDANRTPERMIGVHVDVTDHQEALNQLAERSAELEAIFHASPDIFFRTDTSGVITDYRVSSEARLLMPPEDFMGKRMGDLVPPRVRASYDHAFSNLSRTGQSQTIEYRMRINGENLWHQAVFVPFQRESVAIFIRDITDRKSSEMEVIARTNDLERSNSDLDQFAYVASHDLKSPLRGIQHLTTWIREDSAGLLPAECHEHLERLDEQIVRMQSLLDDLLLYSRAGRMRVTVEAIDLQEMFTEIVALVQPPKEMTITLDKGDVHMETGRAPLFHVLLNLVENAVKYHDRQDGKISVRVSDSSDMEFVEFEICDDGPGIEKEHHERIFRMFQRLDARQTGTGMGLAVVRKMIESRGGIIQMTSQIKQGTTFFFTWPANRDLPEALMEGGDE